MPIRDHVLRVVTANLHGYSPDDGYTQRFQRIGQRLKPLGPDLVGFQEAIRDGGIEETGYQVGRAMSSGEPFGTHFQECHRYKYTYAEGVSVCWRGPLKPVGKPAVIDLNDGLERGVRPMLKRFAVAVELKYQGHKVLFTSVHLDHDAGFGHGTNETVRIGQMKKLIDELKRIYGNDVYASIIVGDLNARPDSQEIAEAWHRGGYRDAFYGAPWTERDTFMGNEGNIPRSPIDYILVSGKCRVVHRGMAYADPSLSDHKAVFADVEIL